MAVTLLSRPDASIDLEPEGHGYWVGEISNIPPGTHYRYVIDGQLERPDPASRFQPEGVHGPSEVIDANRYTWTDQQWKGLPLDQYIIYELHTGTFSPEGTFEGVVKKLPYLQELGVTALELMPVAQFPGTRNWGYDGTYLFAPQLSFGRPDDLKRLVDACHTKGLAVIMDVVYNHLGPEGNYLWDFGPYFTDIYRTPWGSAVNYDGPYSCGARDFVVNNAIFWIQEYHVDALRLDAIHGIFDFSAQHILQDIAEAVRATGEQEGRTVAVIAESDLNDARIIAPIEKGGYGLEGQWSDDFHHALHVLLTGESVGYYEDFGTVEQLATAYRSGFVYTGQYAPFRKRRHGNSPDNCRPVQFVVSAQNHDQVGNRAKGDRHSTLISFEALKVANVAVLLSANIPMLFMGEEYGEANPFLYFIDHGDPNLVEAVREGRKREFESFGWTEVSDPYDVATYEACRLQPRIESDMRQQAHLRWCQDLIHLRKTIPSCGAALKNNTVSTWADEATKTLIVHRKAEEGPEMLLVIGFNKEPVTISVAQPHGTWSRRLDSRMKEYGGKGEDVSSEKFVIQSRGEISVNLPSFPAWIFLQEE
jgi:maltooligosyltrehalose trehalohydrolase